MNDIKDFHTGELKKSAFVIPYEATYVQVWHGVKCYDSVAILIYNTEENNIVLVRQFRPVVYVAKQQSQQNASSEPLPGSVGVTYELCAGIVDKNKTLEEIAAEEVLEECGYHVEPSHLKLITKVRSDVGVLGAHQSIFYVEVTSQQRVSSGGGNASEGELIEVVHYPVEDIPRLIFDSSIERPAMLLFALIWFQSNRMTDNKTAISSS